LVPLLLAISFARRDDTEIATLTILAGLSLVGSILFVVRELVAQHPAVNLRLFRVSGFRLLCGTAFLNTLGLFGAQFMIPIFLQQVMGFTPLQAGLTIVPALIISAFGGTLSGRLSDWFSPRLLILISLLALGVVFRLFSTVAATTTVGILISYIIFYRVCLFSINTPLTALNVRILDDDQVRMGQGLMGMVRNIAAGLGVTMSSVLFERRRTHYQLLSYSNSNVTSPEHREVVQEIGLTLRSAGVHESWIGPMTLSALRQQMNLEAIAAGFRDTFFSIGFCFLIAMLPMLFISGRYTRNR
jgi:DHA2 family multidrug resistance protein